MRRRAGTQSTCQDRRWQLQISHFGDPDVRGLSASCACRNHRGVVPFPQYRDRLIYASIIIGRDKVGVMCLFGAERLV